MSKGIQPSNYQCRTNGHDPWGWTVGFPAKRKNRKKKFFTTISLYFHISKMRNFSGFFCEISFLSASLKNAEFSRIRKCENFAKKYKISRKNTAKLMKKIMRKFCEKNYAKISRKNGNYAINENFAKNAELLKNKCTKLQKFIKKE